MFTNQLKPEGVRKDIRDNKEVDCATAFASYNLIVATLLQLIQANPDASRSNPSTQDIVNVYRFLDQNRESVETNKDESHD